MYNISDMGKVVIKQLNNYFIDIDEIIIHKNVENAFSRCVDNFSMNNSKYISNSSIDMANSIQWSIFLYYLSNSIYKNCKDDKKKTADKVYYLNKIMHSIDWFYAIDLPKNFYAEHPIGSVLGRAQYGEYLFVYQGTTVGGNRHLGSDEIVYPKLGNKIIMMSNSKVIGSATIGNNIIISANAYIKDENIPDNSIVFGQSPNIVIKKTNAMILENEFKRIWKV